MEDDKFLETFESLIKTIKDLIIKQLQKEEKKCMK